MAGDSRILINDQGITISTEGKIVYQAGQHKFEGGQQVVSEIYKLPDAPTDYSLKFKYTSNLPNQVGSEDTNLSLGKELFIVSKKDHSLVQKFILNQNNQDKQLSNSGRFYTQKSEDISAMLFISEVPYLFFRQDLENNNEQYCFDDDFYNVEEDDESHISAADKE